MARLDDLARSHGIQTRYTAETGESREITDDAKRALLGVLDGDPRSGKPGDFASSQHEATRRCVLPDGLHGRRAWGLTCQLYGLRSGRNLGIGDFEDLARLAEIAAGAGAAFLGVSPLHALFLADPDLVSPYSPSTRRFLNPLLIAVDHIAGGSPLIAAAREQDPSAFRRLDGEFVDYRAVASLKTRLLRRLYEDGDAAGDDDLEAFRRQGGTDLRSFALFEALSADQVGSGGHAGWHHWPEALQDRRGDAVARFEADHNSDIRFHEWLQFIADRQLADAQARARAAGMTIGLYLDFAVGVAPDGADTWSDPRLTVGHARIGAPPDLYNSEGQDWGLAPLSPRVLAARDYRPLGDAFDASMRHAGAIRIDHAMGLARLWWIPAGGTPSGGGYVCYPLGAMIDTVAAVSQAHGCLVVGEDLGTVPEGFLSSMAAANILSYHVLYFERGDSGGFLPPAQYPELALACIATHDLATLAGWWARSDIMLRAQAGRLTREASQRDFEDRERDRLALLAALEHERLLPATWADILSGKQPMPDELDESLAAAIHAFAARARSLLFAVQLEDALMSARQPNLPGTTDGYPNWRLRYDATIEDLAADRRFLTIIGAVRAQRDHDRT